MATSESILPGLVERAISSIELSHSFHVNPQRRTDPKTRYAKVDKMCQLKMITPYDKIGDQCWITADSGQSREEQAL